ncbi:MAG TPA: TIGR03960 family B12-binding radical SAM protein [Oscillospiraceae bacterium]|nr:TIGR03960 family B12-binding radical SAM protein [Oscillospiraceae bacterium]HPK35560.1 TIGR03960 family B12-binding radical SAM protein [Oscillospiraceae bacterium]HPR75922.1 TIGR03960 family B12-binding radical SAM protein [Oscillospiraceae bacterium]
MGVTKPGRYIGHETGCVIKNKADVKLRFCFCFPDIYDIGMSYLGQKILYGLLNNDPEIWCERAYAPWPDMEKVLRDHEFPLYGLESGDPLSEFDVIGFTLQYELSYTNILNIIDLGGLPLRAKDRKDAFPLVITGGPCVCNMEPIADFIDLAVFGDGEETLPEVMNVCKQAKAEGWDKEKLLREAVKIEGVYVPSFYDIVYNHDGTVQSVTPKNGAPKTVKKRIVKDLDTMYAPPPGPVPYIEVVQSRAATELFRGCIRGCRFCQAGYIYRPVRERKADTVQDILLDECTVSGYEEMALSSLSTSDYTEIVPLLENLTAETDQKKINLSLPSLRVDNFSSEVLDKVSAVRKSGLTFAPEAGSQRLRDVINKQVTEEEFIRTCKIVFSSGYTSLKLYFMLGLPTETDEDIVAIADMAQRAVDLYYQSAGKQKGRGVNVSIGVSTFIPKPFTPFQWVGQDSEEEIVRKQKLLASSIRSRKITYNYHDMQTSRLEAVFARGNRSLSNVIETAFKSGCRLDGWNEWFKYDLWLDAFKTCGIDMDFFATRTMGENEILPWEHLDIGVTKAHFLREYKRALEGVTTPNCRAKCVGCGASVYGVCGGEKSV